MGKQDRKKRRERLLRLVFLAEHPDFDTNPNIRAEWERLRSETVPLRSDMEAQIIEVLKDDEVIFTGSRAEVRAECEISKEVLYKKLRLGSPDRKKRYYRIKE